MTDTMRSASADVPATLGACGLLTIDLGALRDNYLALNRRAAPARAAAVVYAVVQQLGEGMPRHARHFRRQREVGCEIA